MRGLKGKVLFQFSEGKYFQTYKEKRRVRIGFVEIGCKPQSKRAQLLEKKDKFSELWTAEISPYGIDWLPHIRRTLIHFDPESKRKGVFNKFKKYNPDVVIYYNKISDYDVQTLTPYQREQIITGAKEKQRKGITDILKRNSGSDLQEVILEETENIKKSGIRGRTSEIIGLNLIQEVIPNSMNLVRNGDLKYLREELKPDHEIDGVLVYYNPNSYWTMIKSLQNNPQISVEVNWDIQVPTWISNNN